MVLSVYFISNYISKRELYKLIPKEWYKTAFYPLDCFAKHNNSHKTPKLEYHLGKYKANKLLNCDNCVNYSNFLLLQIYLQAFTC